MVGSKEEMVSQLVIDCGKFKENEENVAIFVIVKVYLQLLWANSFLYSFGNADGFCWSWIMEPGS